VEEGETAEQALLREVKEELGIDLETFRFFRRYVCMTGDAYPNVKYLYSARIAKTPGELVLNEGQRLTAISADERGNFRFANVLAGILEDFIAAGCWPVDNFRSGFPQK
jgi:8-oxo-dGTP pyrophosphatase MutT (NUDIX family)